MATLTPCQQAAAWLVEAQAALHKLLIGSKVESLQHADKSLRYSKADITALRTYIANLQNTVDGCNGITRNRRRILHVVPIG